MTKIRNKDRDILSRKTAEKLQSAVKFSIPKSEQIFCSNGHEKPILILDNKC